MRQNNIQLVLTAIRRQQGNLAERVNKELGRLRISTYCHDKHNLWLQYINFLEQSLNCNYNLTTGYRPFELNIDKPPLRFWSSYIRKSANCNLPVPMQVKWQEAKKRIANATENRAKQYCLPYIEAIPGR